MLIKSNSIASPNDKPPQHKVKVKRYGVHTFTISYGLSLFGISCPVDDDVLVSSVEA